MRKFLIPLLAATALLPAAAAAQDSETPSDGNRQRADRSERVERSQRSERRERIRIERAERSERADHPIRMERSEPADRQVRMERMQRADRDDRPERAERPQRIQRFERQADGRRTDWGERRPTLVDGIRGASRDGQRREAEARNDSQDGARDESRGFGGAIVDSIRRNERDDRDNRDRWGDRDRRDRWSGDWRRDRRYDWRNHRDRYGWRYRLGRYYDPFGSHYRRFSIGFSLYPSYYSSRYWLSDPWSYRLPPAYGPYRWVRYYDDALLVNIYNGRVVDVIHDFFW